MMYRQKQEKRACRMFPPYARKCFPPSAADTP
ncbi:hypothetical protein B23_0516 [Geobacillus thermoleovorans B23]|nr:hypothetical protein B23_0516 [Geobacillus thermoleovorans B23]